ncbi:MAG: PTS fructose-like transporter subunit EIIB, partial [Enterobacterales bacterium]|nr:PTS fructose-like transporter subunit EIIB [Enterobacterales bacterium]
SADVVLLIADIELEGAERFTHCRCVHSSISTFLRFPERTLTAVKKIVTSPQETHINIA